MSTPQTENSEPKTENSKKHNKLELPQQIRLLDWCRQHEDKVKTLPDTQLADMAAAELNFKITTPNLTSVRQAAGIDKLKPTAPPTVEERLERIEKTLGTFIAWSHRELGEGAASDLLKMLGGGQVVVFSQSPAQPSPSLPAHDSPETLPGLEPAN